MSEIEPLCNLIGADLRSLTKDETFLLEADLLEKTCEELKEIFRTHNKDFFRFTKVTTKMENEMLEGNFVRFVIKDILASGEYTIEGIAKYSDTHEDVIHEVISGKNTNPSAAFLRRAIALHRSIRRHLYDEIIKKVFFKYIGQITSESKKKL